MKEEETPIFEQDKKPPFFEQEKKPPFYEQEKSGDSLRIPGPDSGLTLGICSWIDSNQFINYLFINY